MKPQTSKALYKQQIMIYRSIKQFPAFFQISGLPQHPHHFGDGGFEGHVVGFQYREFFLDDFSYLIDFHVTSFMCNLSCHTDQFAGFHPVREGVEEAVVSVLGSPPTPKDSMIRPS